MIRRRTARLVLAGIVALYLGIGALYALNTPPWQSPDEPAHYNYIAQIAEEGCCPVIAPGDWDAAYLSELTTEQFPERADLSPLEYEDHQPPLYYLLLSVVYRLTGGSLLALRLATLVLGTGIVLMTYAALARLFPARLTLALGAAAFVAFIPQHLSVLASVNNDALAELVLATLLAVSAAYFGNPVLPDADGTPRATTRRPRPALLGLLAGLAFLTKLTVYAPAVLVVALAILMRWRAERRSFGWAAGQAAWAAGVALALGALWWVRNAIVYGWPDIFAQAAHESAVVGQLRTAELIAEIGAGPYITRLLTTTFHSFFGQFGWMAVPMSPRVYLVVGLFLAATLAGLGLLAITRRRTPLAAPRRAVVAIFGALAVLVVLQFGYYNLTFVQHQGRYLYPALVPIALAVAAGWWGWSRWLAGRLPARWKPTLRWLPVAVMAFWPALAVYALFRILMPNLG